MFCCYALGSIFAGLCPARLHTVFVFVLRITGSFCSWLTSFLPCLQVDFDNASSEAAVVAAAAAARLHFVIAC
jgi:hypothetical protein